MPGLFPPHLELIRERLIKLVEKREAKGRPLSLKQIGMGIDYSAGAISNFLHRKDIGNVEEIGARIKTYLDREETKETAGLLHVPFVETRQAKKVLQAVQFAQQYGRLVALIGGPGLGKTRSIQQALEADKTAILIQASGIMGPSGVLQDLCDAIGESSTGKLVACLKRIRARLSGSGRCIIVDDAHCLSYKALDVLRTIYDQTGCGVVLAGIKGLKRLLTGTSEEYEQLASRVSGRIFELPEFNESDLALLLEAIVHPSDHEAVMELLGADPRTAGSPRRACNVLEVAGRLAESDRSSDSKIKVKHLRDAMKVAA